MSAPICSRCQKIYSEGTPPAKCVNCGGTVRIPGAKPAAETTKPAAATKPAAVNQVTATPVNTRPTSTRVCCRANCSALAVSSIKYFYHGKRIVMTPATPTLGEGITDLCQAHSDSFTAPGTWTLEKLEKMPGYKEDARSTSSNPAASTSEGSGCFDVFFGLIAVVFLIAVVVGGGYLLIEFLGWLFSDTGGGGGDTDYKIIRVPRWRR